MADEMPAVVPTSEEDASLRHMLRLVVPSVVSTVSMTLMQFVDRYMVSRLGTEALAAVMPAAFVVFLPGGFAMGAMTSLNTFVSQSLGRGNKKQCAHYFWQTTYMGLAYFIVVFAVMYPASPWIFKLMHQPHGVAQMEVVYLRIMLYAHIAAAVNWASNQFFMGIHRPAITLYATLCGQAVNIAANYALIFGKWGMPKMGIAGAAWGTFIGMGVAALINMAVLLGRNMDATFRTRGALRVDFRKMYDLLKVGLPAGIGVMANVALWGVVLFTLVGKFGTEALAATSAALTFTNLSVMPIVGVATALATAVGKSIGAGKKEMAARHTSLCLKIALLYMGTVGVLFFVFRETLMTFWSSDERVIQTGAAILVCAAFYQVFHAARVIYAGALQGAGDTVWLAGISMVGAVGVLALGGALAVRLFPSLGAIGPWIAATVSIVVVGVANRWRFKSNRWMRIDLWQASAGEVPIQVGSNIE